MSKFVAIAVEKAKMYYRKNSKQLTLIIFL